MEQEAVGGVRLPLAFCTVCDRQVLTYLGAEDDDPRQCVHCDTPIDETLLRSATLADLSSSGYAEIPAAKACGSGGCGSGGCRR